MSVSSLSRRCGMLVAVLVLSCAARTGAGEGRINTLTDAEKRAGWCLLFNGKDLDGWKIAENKNAFSVKDGILVVKGRRGHLFYSGDVSGATFKDFHFKADVMTKPKANSGLYIHTAFQKGGWPRKGYECQVNNTHKDRKKTAGIYGVKDNFKAVAEDHEWFHYEIILTGKRIQTKINGETIIDFTEPENHNVRGWPDRRVSEGTFAIQAHDPGSEVHYRNIKVKTPETVKSAKSKYPAASGRTKPAPSARAAKDAGDAKAERLFKMARQAEKMGQRSAAASLYSRVVGQYPESSFAKRAGEKLKSLRK